MKRLITGIALFTLASPYSFAELKDGDDLYEKAGPNSAFLRIVNLGQENIEAALQSQSLQAEGNCSISRTAIVESGPLAIQGNSWNWQGELAAQQVYTLTVRDGEVMHFSQEAKRDPMRARFEVFNFSSQRNVSVLTKNKGQAVFSDLNPTSRKERSLNPLQVELEIATDKTSIPLDSVAFARGRTTSLIICDGPTDLVGTFITE